MNAQLPLEDYRRYGRQMILPGLGLPGQIKLSRASVAVVGAGGLGCPALQYLAAAGVGRLGIIDHDTVEISNLQRQILHNETRLGTYKAESATQAIKQINSRIEVITHICAVTPENAVSLLQPYDIILDCTDNAPTRYLLSDTAVFLHKPLVSGAAQKFEGQLCVYNLGDDGPCYRCLFPKPPNPELAGGCEEVGILGAVTGIIGNLQALEAIKIITGLHDEKPSLLIYSALTVPPFRNIKLRSRRPACSACSKGGEGSGSISETDYVTFCGGPRPDWESRGMQTDAQRKRITAVELHEILRKPIKNRIIDVRPPTEYGICHLPNSINVPIGELVANPRAFSSSDEETYVVCRLGNDSQLAVDALLSAGIGNVKDMIGGLREWSRTVDDTFPVY